MKELKEKTLRKSFEEGALSKEEYERLKDDLASMPEEKNHEKEDEKKDVRLSTDKFLIAGAIVLVLIFAGFIAAALLTKEKPPQTIDELHALNLKGKLNPDEGYIYNDVYSFVRFDGSWYTQLVSPQGTRLYNIQFRYGPRDVESLRVEGSLNISKFNDAQEYYVTFSPLGGNFTAMALAAGDFNQHMTTIFFKQPIAACTTNVTAECRFRPTITCDSTDDIVLYLKDSNRSRVLYDDNCITIEGTGFGMVKGVDRVLYGFYDVMG
jgi:hypothetical protein